MNRLQSIVFTAGALLMVAGAALGMLLKGVAPWLFLPGALMFVAMQARQRYDGDSITLRRLRRIVLASDALLLLTALLLLADHGNPFGLDVLTYVRYVHNNWVVVLLLAAVLQLYTVFRMDAELQREAKKR